MISASIGVIIFVLSTYFKYSVKLGPNGFGLYQPV